MCFYFVVWNQGSGIKINFCFWKDNGKPYQNQMGFLPFQWFTLDDKSLLQTSMCPDWITRSVLIWSKEKPHTGCHTLSTICVHQMTTRRSWTYSTKLMYDDVLFWSLDKAWWCYCLLTVGCKPHKASNNQKSSKKDSSMKDHHIGIVPIYKIISSSHLNQKHESLKWYA